MTDFVQAFHSTKNSKNYDSDNSDNFDYFFTQRKVVESFEVLDKNMTRINKKKNTNYNFLAINIPNIFTKLSENHELHIEIWGDINYRYTGKICNSDGIFPHILIRLTGDTQIFIKLTAQNLKSENKESMTKIGFIQVPKRYQTSPIINDNKLQKDESSELKENNNTSVKKDNKKDKKKKKNKKNDKN